MRSGLGKLLDNVIFETVPPILEPAGFKTVRRKRAWTRVAGDAEQVVAVETDGRSARDGYLVVSLGIGVTYSWEEEREFGAIVGGRSYVHQPVGLRPDGWADRRWRFKSDGELPQLAKEVERVILPALDRFRDPRALRDHFLGQGGLEQAIGLSAAVGDHVLARELVPAVVSKTVRSVGFSAPQSPAVPGRALALAADHGVELSADDEALLRAHLATVIDRWRAGGTALPWVEELEERFLR